MSLPIIITLVVSWLFGIVAILLSIREERLRKQLFNQDEKNKHRLYEIAVLKEIQDRIGYSLDVGKVTDVITGSLKNLLPYSTVSSLVISQNSLIFKTNAEENVNQVFIEKVKSNMVQTLQGLVVTPLPISINDIVIGTVTEVSQESTPNSFFNVPLIINDKVGGVINVASFKPNLYSEEEKTILYQIISQASTALARLEAVLVTEKGKLMAMITSLADGVFMVDTQSQLNVINQTAKDFLHIVKEEPTIIEVLSSFPSETDIGTKLTTVIAKNQPIEIKEVMLNNKVLQIFLTPVLDKNVVDHPVVIGASVLLHDITLEKTIGQMKEDFTNMMVHELRAPLTSIKVSSELLANSESTLPPEQKKQLLNLIDQQSKSLLEEVSTILDAAKLEAGRFKITKAPTDITEVIKEKVNIFIPQAADKHIHLVVTIPDSIPQIACDRQYIARVVQNLISNSMKFTPENGTITIIARRKDQDIEVMVSDTGPGIPKDKQANLFNRFSQVGTASMNHQGTGLGLYISKGIIEAHGGTISLSSEEGHGTTIAFTLPIVTMTEELEIPAVQEVQQPSQPKPTEPLTALPSMQSSPIVAKPVEPTPLVPQNSIPN